MTTLRPEAVGDAEMARILALVGIDPATLDPDGDDNDRLVILRHTLMNPYLIAHTNHISSIERYLNPLAPRIRRSQEYTSHLQSLMRFSYYVFFLKHKHN